MLLTDALAQTWLFDAVGAGMVLFALLYMVSLLADMRGR